MLRFYQKNNVLTNVNIMEIVKIGLKCSEIQTLREVYVSFETKEDICVVFDYYRGGQYFFFIFYIFLPPKWTCKKN